MWLSGLHIPESYLTALVQATCRRHGWALDRCAMSTSVTRFTSEQQLGPADALADGCYVRGLFLEGATWDAQRGCLTRQPPKQLACELPLLKLVPIESERARGGRAFRTPVYVTPSRRDAMGVGLAFEVDLATDEHASLWTLQGVAGVLNSCTM
jgi:dynein heavy chain